MTSEAERLLQSGMVQSFVRQKGGQMNRTPANLSLLTLAALLLFSLLLSSCGVSLLPPTATPTDTPTPTDRPTPTATLTPTPTVTPTDTPTPLPTLTLGDVQEVSSGGYSFRPPLGYQVSVVGTEVDITDDTGTIYLRIVGVKTNQQKIDPEMLVNRFVNTAFLTANGSYTKGPSIGNIPIGSKTGALYNIIGDMYSYPVAGQAALVVPSKNQYLFVMGVAVTAANPNLWEQQGSRVFHAVVDSIAFVP